MCRTVKIKDSPVRMLKNKNETGQLECVINNKGINSDELIVMFALFGMEE